MEVHRRQQIESLFEQALNRPQSERNAWLEEACGGDEALRAAVERLLIAHERGSGILEQPVRSLATGLVTEPVKGQRLGVYRLVEEIGRGGMGIVFKAHHPRLDRFVAIKFLPPHLSRDERAKARFITEAKAASALDHPNICTVYDLGESEEGRLFMAMSCYEGETLAETLDRGPLSAEDCVDLTLQIGRGLERAHEAGIVHRDVKPANIMVTRRGEVKILDFGVATLLDEADVAHVNAAMGTAPYMSPEQVRGEPTDGRTDLWSLGVVMYEMLTGTQPFSGDTAKETLDAVLHADPNSIRILRPDVPDALAEFVEKLLRKNPDERFQDTSEALRYLHAMEATYAGTSPRRHDHLRRWHLLAAAAVLTLFVVPVIFLWAGSPIPTGPPGAVTTDDFGKKRVAIAVLPLDDLSQEGDQEIFAEGMTEELITMLSKIEGLLVISRRSVMQFSGSNAPIPDIASQLGVAYVVTGSLRRYGTQLRMTTTLIDGAENRPLWHESFTREMRDVLTLQADLAHVIAGQIEVTLTPEDEVRLEGTPEVNPAAFDLYVLGRHHRNMDTSEDWLKAADYFRRSTELDPAFAPAWAGLAGVYTLVAGFTDLMSRERAEREAEQAVSRALALDPDLPAAHMVRGLTLETLRWQWTEAAQAFEQASALNASYSDAPYEHAWLLARTGDFDEAEAIARRAARLDPLTPRTRSALPVTLMFAETYGQAVTEARKVIALDPEYHVPFWVIGLVALKQGRYVDAIDVLSKLPSGWREGYTGYALAASGRDAEARAELAELYNRGWFFQAAMIHIGLGEMAEALEQIEQAYEARDGFLVYLKVDPVLKELATEPRYQSLLQKVGLDSQRL